MITEKWGRHKMKRVTIDKIQPGMVLAKTILNADYIVVLAENTVLTEAHLTRLKFLDIAEIYIKDDYAFSANVAGVEALLSRSNAFAGKYKEVLNKVEDVFVSIGKDGHVPQEKLNSLISTSITPMVQDSGAMDYLYQLKNMNHSVYNHSLRVSILSGVLAKWCHMDKVQMNKVILAGMLHDVGKMQLPKELLEKNVENLNPEEMQQYMQHTVKGYDLLAHETVSENVKWAVLQHHERNNGSGYPFHSKGGEIRDAAKIIAIADLYDNITRERTGFAKKTPFDALETIIKEMFERLEPQFCVPFIEHVQQSFLGSKVILSDKSEGTVAFYPLDYAARPLVKVSDELVIDLNLMPELRIIEYNPVN